MSAILSPCETYRYRLERAVVPLAEPLAGTVAWIMVNPSTADAVEDDPTIRKVCGFTARIGGSRIVVGNKFAYRAKDVRKLALVDDPIGEENDHYLEQIMRDADCHIVAWGSLAKLPVRLRTRYLDIVRIADCVGCRLYCFGKTETGDPRHPVMTGYDERFQPWPNDWRHLI